MTSRRSARPFRSLRYDQRIVTRISRLLSWRCALFLWPHPRRRVRRLRSRQCRRPCRRLVDHHRGLRSLVRDRRGQQSRDGRRQGELRPAELRQVRRGQAEDRAEARQGPAGDDRRAVQDPVQAGVRGPARPGAAVPDPQKWIAGEAADQGIKVSARSQTAATRRPRRRPSRRKPTSRSSSSSRA